MCERCNNRIIPAPYMLYKLYNPAKSPTTTENDDHNKEVHTVVKAELEFSTLDLVTPFYLKVHYDSDPVL